jgi:hypothetical protein
MADGVSPLLNKHFQADVILDSPVFCTLAVILFLSTFRTQNMNLGSARIGLE